MEDEPGISFSEALARLAVRLEATEFVLVGLTSFLLNQVTDDPEAVLDAFAESYRGPGYTTVGGVQYQVTPEHRQATDEATANLLNRLKRVVNTAR
jgi:hypothetical protein